MLKRKRDTNPSTDGPATRPTMDGPGLGQGRQQRAGRTSAAVTSATSSTSQAAARNHAVNYLLLVRLKSSSDPTITRILSIPAHFTMAKVADVLTVAFGWAKGYHLSKFELNKIEEPSSILLGTWSNHPPILEILDDESLDIRDSISNSPFFPSHSDKYTPPKLVSLRKMTLRDIFDDSSKYYGTTRLLWEYDLGDGWEHTISFMGKEDAHLRAVMGTQPGATTTCLGGEGHPCAEDSGGNCLDRYKWDLAKVNEALMKIK